MDGAGILTPMSAESERRSDVTRIIATCIHARHLHGRILQRVEYTELAHYVVRRRQHGAARRAGNVLGAMVCRMVCRAYFSYIDLVAAIVLIEPQLDANYQAVKQSSYAWPARSGADFTGHIE
jgi:hypothetical protein